MAEGSAIHRLKEHLQEDREKDQRVALEPLTSAEDPYAFQFFK
jgi:hypothetical protein